MSSIELGGFVEYPEDIDGTEEEFLAYNRCLADEYVNAFYGEDYEALGELDTWLVKTIAMWYSGDDFSRQEFETGAIKTINNRTFLDAIIADKKANYAELFILLGVINPALFALVIAYGDEAQILEYAQVREKEKFFELVMNTFSELEKMYEQLTDIEEQKEFLNKVKDTIEKTRYSKEFGNLILPKENKVVKALIHSEKKHNS